MSAIGPDLALDPVTGDLMLVNGDLVLTSGTQATMQAIRARLLFFVGEWFADLSVGFLDFTTIFSVKNPNLGAIRARAVQALAQTPGVGSVTSVEVTFAIATRLLTITFVVQQDDGTPVSGSIAHQVHP